MTEFEQYFNRPSPDLAYIYEMFLRRVYHCGRCDDPFSIADADTFSVNDKGELDPDCFVGIWTALYLLIDQVNGSDKFKVHKIKESIEEYPTKESFQSICKELFRILDENEISEFPHQESLPYSM
jgi:hypothetical protein